MLDRLEWEPLDKAEALRLAKQVLVDRDAGLLAAVSLRGRIASLSFYRHFRLAWVQVTPPGGAAPCDVMMLLRRREEPPMLLDGSSGPIHAANESEELALTPETASDYARFFCLFVHGDDGPFPIVESVPAAPSGDAAASRQHGEMSRHVAPLKAIGMSAAGAFRFEAVMLHAGALFRARLAVAPAGEITMEDDEPLMADVAGSLRPAVPALYPRSGRLAPGRPAAPALAAAATGGPGGAGLAGQPILDTLVELLLDQALTAQSGHRLIAHFNTTVKSQSPLQQFGEMLVTASPIVVIESNIPFVEEVVAGVLASRVPALASLALVRGTTDPSDDTRVRIEPPNGVPALVLASLHAYRSVADVLRVSHRLGTRRISALIGCERAGDVPGPLREIVDVTLRLPPMSPPVFEALFRKVMGASLPPDWRQPDDLWVASVLHSDLEHPSSFSLSPGDSAKYIRDRVLERLRSVDPAGGLSLSNLHGLGEARLFAEDLIAEIRAAVSKQLPWSEVDRGVLLVGPPGTGKTTLARAIAKDCGVKFIQASAASWQATNHLGEHIRAIRADFAQARRFAPAILFIDEIDSIGNRELFSGPGMQYQTEVVNALLEQMQGLDPAAPVIVIGATNDDRRVDPALRRAGRLDRRIEIPYPNSDALAAIFDHYLEPHARAGRLAADVDTKALGRMGLRRTGADVELFVRGAWRRARKAGRPLAQADLVAELTGKARDPRAIPVMSPEEIERVALHEAGHALARCLSSTGGKDITFVSIVPRADGSLGFVAFAPSERQFVTRAEYLEHIEVALAGRAAEDIVYGADGVSGGAYQDLRDATRTTQHIVTQLGLGPEGTLAWSETATPAHAEQTEKLLGAAYGSIKKKLGARREDLQHLARVLVQRQEMTGAELLQVIGR